MDISIKRLDSVHILQIDGSVILLKDYEVKTAANGSAEVCVKFDVTGGIEHLDWPCCHTVDANGNVTDNAE